MATTTFSAVLDGTWTELVDGADYASCLVQVTSAPMALAIGASEPSAGSADYVIVTDLQPFMSLTLTTGDLVFGRALNGSATVRIVQTEATP